MDRKEKLEKYFKRIGLEYKEPFSADLENLKLLQYAHLMTIPYENLDILKGKPLSLKADDLYEKVIEQKRGGYCFELNGLFCWLLRTLGYKVTEYMARYIRGEAVIPPMRRHRVIKVELPEGDYLADIGIGDKAPRWPLLMKTGVEQEQFGEIYKFEKDDFYGWVIYDLHEGSWREFFAFTEEYQLDIDFEMPSFWCEKNPASPFISCPIFCLKTEKGMYTLMGDIFRDSSGEALITKELSTDDERREIYKKYFGLEY